VTGIGPFVRRCVWYLSIPMHPRVNIASGVIGGLLGGAFVYALTKRSAQAPAPLIQRPSPPDARADERQRRLIELNAEADGVSMAQAFVVFPLYAVYAILRELCEGATSKARHLRHRTTGRAAEPARPTGPAALAFVAVLAWLAVSSFQTRDNRDLMVVWGLIFVALGTLLVTPQLLIADRIARLEQRWLNSRMPALQIAFGRHAYRLLRGLVRLAIAIAAISFLAALISYAALDSGWVNRSVSGSGRTIWNAAVVVSLVSIIVLVVGTALGRAFGRPGTLPPEPVTVEAFAERLDDPAARLALLRGAVLMVLFGTLLQIVAITFLPS